MYTLKHDIVDKGPSGSKAALRPSGAPRHLARDRAVLPPHLSAVFDQHLNHYPPSSTHHHHQPPSQFLVCGIKSVTWNVYDLIRPWNDLLACRLSDETVDRLPPPSASAPALLLKLAIRAQHRWIGYQLSLKGACGFVFHKFLHV